MKTIKSFLFKADIFAPHFEFYLRNHETRYSTKLGGIYTIMIVLTTLSYGGVKLQQWFTQNISPVTEIKQLICHLYRSCQQMGPQTAIDLSKKVAIIPYFSFKNKNESLFIPLMQNCSSDSIFLQQYELQSESQTPSLKILSSQNVSLRQMMVLNFARCNQSLLALSNSSKECANETEIDKYIEQRPFFLLHFNLQIYDFSLQKSVNQTVETILTIDIANFMCGQIGIQRQHLITDHGYMLFGSKSHVQLFSDYQYLSIPIPKPIQVTLTPGLLGSLFIFSESKIQIVQMNYPAISDVCVMIFSFFRMFISIGNVIIKKRSIYLLLTKVKEHLIVKSQHLRRKEESLTPHHKHSKTIIPQVMRAYDKKLNVFNLIREIMKNSEKVEKIEKMKEQTRSTKISNPAGEGGQQNIQGLKNPAFEIFASDQEENKEQCLIEDVELRYYYIEESPRDKDGRSHSSTGKIPPDLNLDFERRFSY